MSDIPEGWYADPADPLVQRRWDGEQWTDETRPTPPAPPPPPAPDAGTATSSPDESAAGDGSQFSIAEDGRNGKVTFGAKGLERVLKKHIGKDDRQFIPYTSISMVSHDRKHLGRDKVTVQVGSKGYEWKIATDAEGFVDKLNRLIS